MLAGEVPPLVFAAPGAFLSPVLGERNELVPDVVDVQPINTLRAYRS